MLDKTTDLLPKLASRTLPGLDLGEGMHVPCYDGYSILNLPATVCRLLGTPGVASKASPPLADELLDLLDAGQGKDLRHVILLVLDGLGLETFQRVLAEGDPPVWRRLADEAMLAPLTSVSPSTTTAALTTLWTGVPPAAHGIVGYEVWLREYGVVANMINHSAASFIGDPGGLRRAGFHPENFLPVPSLGGHLASHGIHPAAWMHHSISRSGLSAMHLQQVQVNPFRNPADLWVGLRQQMLAQSGRAAQGRRTYTYVYWGDLDELSHRYGPHDDRVRVEFASFSQAFQRAFLDRLGARRRHDTLVLLTADHGQIHTPPNSAFELRNHPDFVRCLALPITGENRLAYLHVRPGREERVREYVEAAWPGWFTMVPSRAAVEAGLFGAPPASPQTEDRVGDWIVIARRNAFLWGATKENTMLGRHGGLSREEMLVPLFAFRV